MKNTVITCDGDRPFLFIKEAAQQAEISISTIDREVKAGRFPPKIKLSARRRGFLRMQFNQWVEGKRGGWDLFASGAA